MAHIVIKREYGPIGNSGEQLILHGVAIDPTTRSTTGVLWQKLWNRKQSQNSHMKRQGFKHAEQRREKNNSDPFAEKESYRWVKP